MDIHSVGANHPSYGLSWNVYDHLMTYGKKTLPDGTMMYDYSTLEPELATSWQLAPDGTSVTFTLRQDAKFHDGTPVTAQDVKWSFDRAVSIGGFPTFQMKAGSLEKPEQFVVVDDHTLRINFLRQDRLTMPDQAVPVAIVINSKLAQQHTTPSDPWAAEWLKNNTLVEGRSRPDEIITDELRPDLVREARAHWGVENNIYQFGHRGYVAVQGGAHDCLYTYMQDLVAGHYRLPWEDQVVETDGTSCGFPAPTRVYQPQETPLESMPRRRYA
jgi:Bacterial extracellular solute-binding proteins, family 5 Middle